MTRSNPVKTLCIGLLLLTTLAAAPATRPVLSRDVAATDTAGQSHRLLDSDAKAVVMFFVGVECPVSNGYAPEINRLAVDYGPRGATFYVVYSGTDVTTDAAARHAKEFKFTCPALVDPRCDLARAAGATTTLEAAVILPDGSLVYRGRIDNQYITLGKKRFGPTSHDLRDVLDAVVAGKSIEPRFTAAVGCTIVMPEMKKP